MPFSKADRLGAGKAEKKRWTLFTALKTASSRSFFSLVSRERNCTAVGLKE